MYIAGLRIYDTTERLTGAPPTLGGRPASPPRAGDALAALTQPPSSPQPFSARPSCKPLDSQISCARLQSRQASGTSAQPAMNRRTYGGPRLWLRADSTSSGASLYKPCRVQQTPAQACPPVTTHAEAPQGLEPRHSSPTLPRTLMIGLEAGKVRARAARAAAGARAARGAVRAARLAAGAAAQAAVAAGVAAGRLAHVLMMRALSARVRDIDLHRRARS